MRWIAKRALGDLRRRRWFGEATGFAGVTVRDSPRRAAGSFGEGLGFREGDTPYQADTQPVRQSTNPLETAA